MFRIDYVESADPIVGLLKSRPHEIFNRPYAGYLIFLFGITDPSVANWMRSHLIALDSLTGPDIAGVVFAKRVGVRARVTSQETRRRDGRKVRRDGSVELSDISFDTSPMVRDGTAKWDDSVKELQATTYAADEMARAFDVIADLPCLIVADAVPSPQIEVLRLTDIVLPNVLPLLRATLGDFTRSARIGGCLAHLKNLQLCSESRQELAWEIDRTKSSWETKLQAVDFDEPDRLRKAFSYLLAGSARKLDRQLRTVSNISAEALQKSVISTSFHARTLQQYSKTIDNLSWYLDHEEWPLSSEKQQRLHLIYDTLYIASFSLKTQRKGKIIWSFSR